MQKLKMKTAKKANAKGRWQREAKALVALALSGFFLIALLSYNPLLYLSDQASPVGPVGAWLGWSFFWGFGYAGFLFPLALLFYGLSGFIRPKLASGWPAATGVALLLISATGLFARTSDAVQGVKIHKGGVLGAGVVNLLSHTVGEVGTLLVLATSIPLGLLLLTQLSYAVLWRSGRTRLNGWVGKKRKTKETGRPVQQELPLIASPEPEKTEPIPPLSIMEAKPRSTLMERGLAWQETFDFGKGGEQSFQLPPVGLLKMPPPSERKRTREELQANADTLRKKLQDFGVEGRIVQVNPGPVITAYEFEPAAGVKVNQVVNLSDDLALAMKAAAVRVVGPIPGRGTVAIEAPNPEASMVYLREVFVSEEFIKAKGKLVLAFGKDTIGQPYVSDLASMPHLLIAGSTGSGKSVGLNCMICSILYKATPAEVRFLMIDPKRLELGVYEGIPHLMAPVVTDAKEAAARLKWIVGKMDERYKLLAGKRVRNIEGYNREVTEQEEKLPYWVVIVDELADLMMVSAGEVENSLARLAQVARAVGIHLIIATQRPSVDVITGLIKANFPARIAYQVASKVDSRTVLDQNGAEGLLGKGDMLFLPPGASRPVRVHGSWVSEEEIRQVTDFLRKQGTAVYEEVELPTDGNGEGAEGAVRDDLYWDAVRLVISQHQGSISFLQRRLRLGYPKAARFIDMMEQDRILGPGDGAKPREVLQGPDYLAKRGK